MSFRVPEKFRVRTGPLASTAAIGNAGAFDIRLPHSQRQGKRRAATGLTRSDEDGATASV